MNSDELISILTKHSPKEAISESDSMVVDLAINGDDLDELYFDLLDNHNIDLRELDNLENYFHSEEELLDMLYPYKWFMHKVGLRKKPPIRILTPFFVLDLIKFVSSK